MIWLLAAPALIALGVLLSILAMCYGALITGRESGMDEMVERIDELQMMSTAYGLDAHPSGASHVISELADMANSYKATSKFFGAKW